MAHRTGSRFGWHAPRQTCKETRMKSPLMILAGALIASLISLPAIAETAQDRELAQRICADQTGSAFNICVKQQLRNFDCAKAGNRASQQCAGLLGWEFRQCTQRMIPEVDCSTLRARDRQQCELNQSAYVACSGKGGEEHMNCLRKHFSSQ
jgi:hypothetical protein